MDMRERGMRGLHELVLEFAFGAWGKGAKRNERVQGDAEEVTVVLCVIRSVLLF